MKKIIFALIAVLLFFAVLEGGLRLFHYQGAPAFSQAVYDIRFTVAGELFGEFDEHRFWKLPNVEPHFSGDAVKIICMADSVTVMYQGRGYPDLLSESLAKAGYEKPTEIFNAGVPEYTSYQGRVYLERELIGTKPNLVTINFGWNDHWDARTGVPDHKVRYPSKLQRQGIEGLFKIRTYRLFRSAILSQRFSLRVPPDNYRENIAAMIDTSQNHGAKALVIAPVFLERKQGWIQTHQVYTQIAKEVAKQKGVPFVDLQPQFANSPELFIEPEVDQVHFNWQGAQLIADAVAETAVEERLLP